jgi:hypothetical protein
MNPQLITAPGRIEIHIWGERFTTYEIDGAAPGFTALFARGLRAVTQPGPADRGLWVMHGNVNGIAFGTGEQSDRPIGRIVPTDLLARRGSHSVGFHHKCSWIAPDGVCLLHEERTVRAAHGPSAGALLDFGITFSAAGDAVELGRTESALLCTRVAPNLLPSGGGQLRSSTDEFGPEAVHSRQAMWCACTGVVQGETVGMAILEHPGNPWSPSPWVAREDGLISPSPFGWRSLTLEPERPLVLRYRIVVHSGYVEAGWVRARLADWLRE